MKAFKYSSSKFFATLGAVLATSLSLLAADPTGTWKWTMTTQDGSTRDVTMKLKMADGKITGSVNGRNNTETEIADAKLDGSKLTFKVVRERNGDKITSNYNAEIKGDDLTGKISTEINGENRDRDWKAHREGAKAASIDGTWDWTFKRQDGTETKSTLKLKADGEKLTGTAQREGSDPAEIKDGSIKDGVVSFSVERERDGTKFVAKYNGKLEGDKITGKLKVNFNGEDRELEWNPTRTK